MKENSKPKNSKGVKMKENSKLGVNSSKNSKGNSANLANSVNLKANSSPNSNLGSNLKAIFALPKWAKIFLVALTALAAVGLVAAFSLKIWASDKIEIGEIVLKGIDRGAQTRILRAENVAEQEIKAFLQSLDTQSPKFEAKEGLQGTQNSVAPSKFAYQNRLYFARLDFLLRSKVIAYIDIQGISWAEGVDKNAVSDISSHNRWVKFATTQDLISQGFNDKNLGKVEYKMDFSPLIKTILKYYFAILFGFLFAMIFVRCLLNVAVSFWRSLPPKLNTQSTATRDDKNTAKSPNLKQLSRKDYGFLALAFALCAGICAFSFWLGFPGWMADDYDPYRQYMLIKDNWHPVFISYVLQGLYFIFGKHAYYLFLLNLVSFYLGLFLLISAFYLHYKNSIAILLIFPTFIGNLYLSNFSQLNYVSLAGLCFCLYFLLLFLMLVPLNTNKMQKNIAKFLWILLFILMFFAIMWRHNAIFSVFPVFFVLCYIFLKNRGLNSKNFLKLYVALIFLSAVLCVVIVKGTPKILSSGDSYPANHVFLHQIAGACVPANDLTCFKSEWYSKEKAFMDAKKIYQNNLVNADSFSCWGDMNFSCSKLDGLYSYWLKAIIKHPYNYLKHELRFIKAMWLQNPKNDDFNSTSNGFARATIKNPYIIQRKPQLKPPYPDFYRDFFINFPKNEHSIVFDAKKEKLYTLLYDGLPILNHIYGVLINFFILVTSFILLFKKSIRNDLLIFSFSASFAGFFSAVFIAGFSPVAWSRYMSPIMYLAVISLIGFIVFVLENHLHKNLQKFKVASLG